MKLISTLGLILIASTMYSQQPNSVPLPYHTIPDYPATYTTGTVVARMIDGLGFRYYWATEGLRSEDLNYRPAVDSRSIEETLDHLYSLSQVILNSGLKKENDSRGEQLEEHTFDEKRKQTLLNLKTASDIFMEVADLSTHTLQFVSDRGATEYPFWNQINGPLEDAVWHSGQIVMMRRAAGNPIDPNVSFFMGKKRNNP